MEGKVFLGIDGGGTKTAYLLESSGKIFKTEQGTIHLSQVNRDEFKENIKSGVEKLCLEAGISVDDIDYSFIAIPGFGQYPDNELFMEKFFDDYFSKSSYKMGNDCVNAWAGSLEAKEGINLILGTGSIAYGVDKNFNGKRSGGWGPFLGDEASGYYIGKKLLNIFTKMSDSRLEKTILYTKIRDYFGIEDDMEIIEIAENLKRDEVAALGKLVGELLNQGEKNTLKLMDEIGYEAASIIASLIKTQDYNFPINVSFSGGVCKIGEPLINAIKENLDYPINIIKAKYTPVEGSLLLAKKYFNKEIYIV